MDLLLLQIASINIRELDLWFLLETSKEETRFFGIREDIILHVCVRLPISARIS